MKRSTAKLLDKAFLLLATLGLAGKAYHVPSKPFWDALLGNRPYVMLVLLGIAGVFGALTPFEAWQARAMADRNVIMRRSILSSFGKLLVISQAIEPPLETGDLALHVWRKRRTLRHPIRGVLKRLATYRMSTHPVTRRFTPVLGEGVVGLCWKYDREYAVDVGPLAAELTDRDAFDRVREDDPERVMNLTWEGFDRVKHRAAVLATPIRNGRSKFVGCISLDASHGYPVLYRREVLEEMTNLGIYIGREDFECI
ncbi:hypothetical protein [Amycolatopsis sp. 195334CR]|uniref:hypothetical protein n=1 Tax=Amycolatopsis sp. 195334CR TaxID=2814588 RepID=UPI001A8EE65B|nr:hypothetical protein [Amycolatopsis sp. 195334CR]MBN6034961.1 hypothetical protein [Amycolatopsis sp. 195334CR]